ncbi:MAG: adenosylmethionine--8-amino-7-oxononanoate transaminase [Bacteroidales bacterium]|jgi:adenosylmethionine-8-amino-7-oxononanoate aminotransferase|nr:adenosylmethionine--8-amino-7-oxononanoate transaminase [Bacteroidales bacterium]
MNNKDTLEYDKQHIWHPYTSTTKPLACYEVKRANGVYLELADGRQIIDGMSSWWATIHGYNNKTLNDAAKKQLDNMSHVMFGGITHKPAVELAKKLIEISPSKLQKVFFSDSGSVAVEVAMKMALQYWHSLGKPTKKEFVSLRKGYHGDTWHAMSVCDPETGMHQIFNGVLSKQNFAQAPKCGFYDKYDNQDIKSLEEIVEKKHANIAAIILEPIVQGAGGMNIYNPQYLIDAKLLCEKYDILFIADEIATGFGRTGELFACNHANIEPDIMCVGKALTGGYLTLAATLASNKIANTISSGSPGVFMHGPTFMGNPLACSIALANIKLLLSYNWKIKIKNIENQLKENLYQAKNYNNVSKVRVLGAIGVIEMKNNVDIEKIQKEFVEEGIWVRPFGKLIYIMPPYIITEKELNILTSSLLKVVRNN